MIDLVLADDHPIVLDGLEGLFARLPDTRVVARCVDAEEAVLSVRTRRPHVLILDLRLPDRGGLWVLEALRAEENPVRSILLTAGLEDAEVIRALGLGARGVVLKESAPSRLVEFVRRVHAGEQCLDERLVTRPCGAPTPSAGTVDPIHSLTQREREIVVKVARGLRNKAIAREMGIAEGTVKVHLHNIYEKLGVGSRVALTLQAQSGGLG